MPISFVRHAQSATNAGHPRGTDWLTNITDRGIQQAEAVGKVLPKCDLVICSPFIRAQETAVLATPLIVSKQCSSEIWRVEEFTFISQCRGHDEYEDRANAYWARNDIDYRDGPDAESFVMFFERVREMLAKMERLDAIVFSHSGFMKAVYWIVCNGATDMKAFRNFCHFFRVPNTAIMKLEWNGKWFPSMPTANHLPENERR